jgi:subtilisin family serine protease
MKKGRFLYLAILISLIASAIAGRSFTDREQPRGIPTGTKRPKLTNPLKHPPFVQSPSVTLNVLGVAASTLNGLVSATDPQGLPLTYSITAAPKLGTASINSSTGEFTYSIAGHTQATRDSFMVAVSNGSSESAALVRVPLAADPLLQTQWHIKNTGQYAFSSTRPVTENDMNVTGAWTAGYSGKGIKVGIVDTGLEAAHEDLAANVDVGNSFNFLTGSNDPSRAPDDVGFDHGTAVAGIIGATAFNGKGGRGVAYDVRLRGYNLLESFSIANMAKSMGSDPISEDNDLFNASFGDTAPSLPTISGAYQAITGTTLGLRNGLGAAIVNAAGNDFQGWSYYQEYELCAAANMFNVSCGDPANDERRGGYAPIIVGAIDADGKHSGYSNTGSSLWISAPGGEYGLNLEYTESDNFAPAIITTNRTGCENSATPDPVNPLDSKGENPFAKDCQYTAAMNGTSAATPNVAGVIAMMLEANPNLSVRDLKYILAKTAKKTDPTFSGVSTRDIVPGARVVLERGWETNAAGWTFSNRYGFGAVDAAAAVEMAKSYTSYLPNVSEDSPWHESLAAPPATIPAMSTRGTSIVFNVTESFATVEFVVVVLNIASTPSLICNQIELASPSGTKSILIHAANGLANTSVIDSRIVSNAFYGEPPNGDWTLTFYDWCPADMGDTRLSTVRPQSLAIVGH